MSYFPTSCFKAFDAIYKKSSALLPYSEYNMALRWVPKHYHHGS
jgi:hypothetical protein